MKGYVGQTKSPRLIERLSREGIGESTQPHEWPPRRLPYFLDNGAFKDWRSGTAFNELRFMRVVERVDQEGPRPDFLVVPDRVADPSSLEFSLSWVPRVQGVAPLALVVQDGMTEENVRAALRRGFSMLFVGGSLQWKLSTAAAWVKLAHAAGMPCHIGRIGTRRRARWAREIGADSVDSCGPLYSTENLNAWLCGMRDEYQAHLFGPIPPPAQAHTIVRKKRDQRCE